MRIVAGAWRGQPLKQPPESITRPTTDRVREALFSAIESRVDIEGLRVLDAFAGSGALGLEALSRGAAHATFCEVNGKVLPVLKANVAALRGAQARATVLRADVLKRPPIASAPFDLVLLDPPYAVPAADIAAMVAALEEAGALASDALVHYEHAKKDTSAAQDSFERIQWDTAVAKRYGDIAFELYRRNR
ncbi:MAG: 16S rRNA (guanine(966)-N(2))-methyltransferase RsmD [Coriobacteriia bacterium]|nr:16S rRNA (guanine(966)-N(2))-methyltransferase RsmD [Coriobacteriia bacterium]